MDPERSASRCHLFTVRLWTEQVGHNRFKWRGQIEHVLSGAYCYFQDWATLTAYLEAKLRELNREEAS